MSVVVVTTTRSERMKHDDSAIESHTVVSHEE